MPVISDITTNHKVVHYGLALSSKQSMPKTQLMSITFRIGSNKGLVIVGVQTPEFSDEKNINSANAAVQNFQIKYPIILDNNYVNWNAYGNSYWPRDYLVDNQGFIRYNHIGEGDYSQTEQMIQSLLAEGVTT